MAIKNTVSSFFDPCLAIVKSIFDCLECRLLVCIHDIKMSNTIERIIRLYHVFGITGAHSFKRIDS